jgi:uncharacterized protein (TIGR03382 family)
MPSSAEACSISECERLVDVELVQDGAIPAGETALVLRPVLSEDFPRFNPEKSQAAVAVTVTPTMGGAAVAGEVVAIDVLQLLVWRPQVPLDPDSEYQVVVTVDNAGLEYAECGPDGFERMFAVTTGAVMAVPLTVPEVTASAELVSVPLLSPETMVCCDGAIPIDQSGSCGPAVSWFEGTCAAGSAYGSLEVTAKIDPAAIEATLGQVGFHFAGKAFAPGASEVTRPSDEPLCGQLTAIHLMTGETMTGSEVCVGDELAEMLGEHAIDPSPGLAACAGEPYTCTVIPFGPNGELWDAEDCTPWPEGQATTGDPTTGGPTTGEGPVTEGASESESGSGSSGTDSAGGTGGDGDKQGCACTSSGAPSPWGLALLLVWPGRRRRAVPAR